MRHHAARLLAPLMFVATGLAAGLLLAPLSAWSQGINDEIAHPPTDGVESAATAGGAEISSSGPQGGADESELAALVDQITALEARIDAQDARIETLEKAREEPVKAPFRVVDSAGTAIFSVEGSGGEVTATVGKGNNGVNFFVGASTGPQVVIQKSQQSASLMVNSNGPTLALSAAEQSIVLGAQDGAMAMHIEDGASGVVATAGGSDGPTFALTSAGKKVLDFSGGASVPVLRVQKDEKTYVAIQSDPAAVVAFSDNHRAQISTRDGGGFGIWEDEKPRALLGFTNGYPEMVLIPQDGSNVLRAGFGTDGQPAFTVRSTDKKELASLSSDGVAGKLVLSDSSGEIAKLGTLGGIGSLVLSKAGQKQISLGASETNANPAVRAYFGGQLVMAAGAVSEGYGIVQLVGGGQVAAEMTADTSGHGAVSVMSSNKVVAAITSLDDPGKGLVLVRSGGTAVAHMGTGKSGGGNFTATDPGGNNVVSAGYEPDGPGSVCVDNNGGKCLGEGLTGMEGFH